MSKTADVAVIGAGIIGASCADHLARRGQRVVVLERESAPGIHSTGKSAAGVRVQFTTESNIRMSELSIRAYREFPARHGKEVGYQSIGYLLLVPRDRWPAHSRSLALQRRLGVPVEEYTPEEAQRFVHFRTEGLHATTYGPIDGVIDPHGACMAWVELGRERGVEYLFDAPVRSFRRGGAGWRIETAQGTVEAKFVVNATGAWSGRTGALADLEVPVLPLRTMIFMTEPIDDPRTYPLTIDLDTGFYLRSEGKRVLFGMTDEEEEYGFVEGLSEEWLEQTALTGARRFPWFADVGLDVKASWFGYYEVSPDNNPIIGRHPDAENWIDACGFSGHGVMHAPATGLLVAETIVDGEAKTLSLDAYRHTRFAGDTVGEANIF